MSGLSFIEQFGYRITDYSSQYGNLNGVSYTANNILGQPSRYPAYGDFSETYVPRTYGHWWKKSPCAPPSLPNCEDDKNLSQDFIDIQFQKPVYPFSLSVFETYNSGCVRRIWAGDGKGSWKLLCEKPRQDSLHVSQIYTPQLKDTNIRTSVIRLEIDCYFSKYYTELDAILLVGTFTHPTFEDTLKFSVAGLMKKIVSMGLHQLTPDTNIIENIRRTCFISVASPANNRINLEKLPEEILQTILSHLDLRSLCAFSCVSYSLNNASKDPYLLTSVNLKPYWYCINRQALEWVSVRSKLLQFLDMSWCGAYGRLSASDFSWFITQVGKRLRVLRLENCNFLNNESLYWVSTTCCSLEELNLRGCRQLEPPAFWHLGRLHQIERLVLDFTQIELPTLLVNMQAMTSLKYLSIAACPRLALGGSLDEIIRWLSRHRPDIRALDVWRSGHLSNHGMEMLIGLTKLEELDLGWCGLPPNGHWISQLAYRSRHLQKLFLTAARIVTDADLIAISKYCTSIKQLDLLGNSYITQEGCSRLLEGCKKLELLDIGYCAQIDASHVSTWRHSYPNVSIKSIFTGDEDE